MPDLPDGSPERYTCANCGEGGLGLYGHYTLGGFTCTPTPDDETDES